MKKVLSILMAGVMVAGLTACGGQKTPETSAASAQAPAQSTTESAGQEAPAEEQTDTLALYTSASTSEYELIVELFKQKYPDIAVEVVSAGTGELSSRIVAEASNPAGDVLMGGGTSTYEGISEYLEPYTSENLDMVFPEFKPASDKWTPCYINVNSIIINKELAGELGVTVDGWESLTDEKLNGKIAFADPSASASALEQLVNMLTAMSSSGTPDGGWEYVERFLKNLDGKISSSSSACYKGVVEGEYAVGLTNEDKAISYIAAGANVGVAYPKEGITLRTSNIGIIKGGANSYNAKLFVDFVTSEECQTQMESQLYVRPVRTDVPMTTEGRLATEELVSLPYPTDWATDNSDQIKVQFQDTWTSLD